MKVLKNIFLVSLVCFGTIAFAKYAQIQFQTLRGDWASSGVLQRGLQRDIEPNDNPNYICQWQLFDHKVFTDENGKSFQKVSWTNLDFDKENTSFISSDLNWKVAYVYEHPAGANMNKDKEVLLNSGESSNLLTLNHHFKVQYLRTNRKSEPYKINFNITLKQNFKDLIVTSHNNKSFERDEVNLVSSTYINVESNKNERFDEIRAEVHCQKLN